MPGTKSRLAIPVLSGVEDWCKVLQDENQDRLGLTDMTVISGHSVRPRPATNVEEKNGAGKKEEVTAEEGQRQMVARKEGPVQDAAIGKVQDSREC